MEQYICYRYVNTRIMTAAMNPKPEKLRRDVILKFKNLQVTARTLKDELVPFVLCWINLIEIHVKYIFRSLKKKSIACFGVVSKIGKYNDIIKYALGLRLFRLVQNWVWKLEISVKPSFAGKIVHRHEMLWNTRTEAVNTNKCFNPDVLEFICYSPNNI